MTGTVISLLAGSVLFCAASSDLWILQEISPSTPLELTIRTPVLALLEQTCGQPSVFHPMRLARGRGQILAPDEARILSAYESYRRPPNKALIAGLALAAILPFLLFTSYLRVVGGTARLLRTQLVLLALVLVVAISGKALLLMTAWSAYWIPFIVAMLPAALFLGRRIAAATSMVAAASIGLLTPIDIPMVIVLATQGFAATAALRGASDRRAALFAVFAASVAGVVAISALSLLSTGRLPIGDLHIDEPTALTFLLRSDLLAVAASPLISGILALAAGPTIQRLLHQIPQSELARLADFEHPLLRQLATSAPGTWAHSLSMANMAEMAANAIGANGLLVRVGAYFHDIGKSERPDYFIENQRQNNPHDEMTPEESVKAIVSHVEIGTVLARRHRLPPAITDFICTHHGSDRLEYFWHKKLESGTRSNEVDEDAYRYPGMPPHSRETAVLALCDSVEAASKSLESPNADDVRRMVRQITFSKIQTGMLDSSGLTIADLRKIMTSLVESISSGLHTRVKYPWQQPGGDRDITLVTHPDGYGPKNRRSVASGSVSGATPAAQGHSRTSGRSSDRRSRKKRKG